MNYSKAVSKYKKADEIIAYYADPDLCASGVLSDIKKFYPQSKGKKFDRFANIAIICAMAYPVYHQIYKSHHLLKNGLIPNIEFLSFTLSVGSPDLFLKTDEMKAYQKLPECVKALSMKCNQKLTFFNQFKYVDFNKLSASVNLEHCCWMAQRFGKHRVNGFYLGDGDFLFDRVWKGIELEA